MNTTETPQLPELSDEAIERMERAVFSVTTSGRSAPTTSESSRRRRPRRWLIATGIAAAFVAGILVTPPILSAVNGGGGIVAADGASITLRQSPVEMVVPESALRDMSSSGADGSAINADASAPDERETITTANATVHVRDVSTAATEIAAIAERFDGWVESMSIGRGGLPIEPNNPALTEADYGWISIRVPAEDLQEVTALLSDTGDVRSSSINTQDVTSAAVDLRARVEATRASVERLTELMAQTGSVAELIEAEVALTDRQAQLEAYEQQLANLDNQVAMSSLHVELIREAVAADPDPDGFTDGLFAGWNGLIVSLNALVIATGFLLPWLGAAAIIALLIWLVARRRRARRQPTE